MWEMKENRKITQCFLIHKTGEKFWVGIKKSGKKFGRGIKKSGEIFGRVLKSRGKIWSGKILVTSPKI